MDKNDPEVLLALDGLSDQSVWKTETGCQVSNIFPIWPLDECEDNCVTVRDGKVLL